MRNAAKLAYVLLVFTFAAVPGAASALDDLRHYAFVVGQRAPEVVALDTRNDTVAARYPLAGVPRQIFVLDHANLLVAAIRDSSTVELVDLGTGRVQKPITTGHAADLLQYSPEKDVLAIADMARGSLSLVALSSGAINARLADLGRPTSMIFGPDGNHLFVANGAKNEIAAIDIATGAVASRIEIDAPAAAGVTGLARTPNGWLGFAVPADPGAPVAMFDLRGHKVLARLPRGRGPSRGFSTADGAFVIVPNNGDGTISLLSLFTRTEAARLPAARDMVGVGTGWFETAAFVSSGDEGGKVLVLDMINRMLAGTIPVPGRPGIGATTPDGLKLYVPLSDADKVAVISTRERRVTKLIGGVGTAPSAVQIASALAFCH